MSEHLIEICYADFDEVNDLWLLIIWTREVVSDFIVCSVVFIVLHCFIDLDMSVKLLLLMYEMKQDYKIIFFWLRCVVATLFLTDIALKISLFYFMLITKP